MDVIDKKILSLLQADGRKSCDKISTVVGLSVSAVNERIKRLQKQKVILGYQAHISPEKMGLLVTAFIKILLKEPSDKAAFLNELKKQMEVIECHHVTGEWTYLLKTRCKNNSHLETLLTDKIKGIPGVVRTETLIALSSPLEKASLPLDL